MANYKYRGRYKEKRDRERAEKRRWLRAYKVENGCAICGESHPACLVFHHMDELGKKDFNIGMNIALSWDRIVAEVEKCQVLCANCHRKLHYKEKDTGQLNLFKEIKKN